ncbi:type II toxin-antitoxin system RelE/ParE family toxin [Parabacteroides sp. AF17-28]|jgi:plasmid stabilization system protein ParE|uniref:type II toxin-antitoxin system RelE/ParE family toxin n=1 Tax=Parabacteroides sp. AF17-28 TaxID=2292241 RepID=UPI000F00EAB3|nr:type II toxin-antitoxin system RelE/ParE family toxin [Parabacteroides sp. AF17-28]RHR60813.1 type II toxin-antitoxin system RelE/ParE family toxin [Parabacteroides sp. AF17-28]
MAGLNRDIIWTSDVLDEIEETITYYDKRNGSNYYSNRLIKTFHQTMERASLFPLSGHATEYPHVRYLITVPYYSLFYHFNNQAITVLVLWDNRREPSRLTYTLRNLSPQYLCEPEVPYGKQHKPDSGSGK